MIAHQKGFSAVEILIGIVIVGLLGAVGWLVYDRQSSNNVQPANSQVTTSQGEVTPTKAVSDTLEAEKVDPNEGYLVVKEWGLRFKVPAGLTDVRYAVQGDTVAFFAKPSDSSYEYISDFDMFEDGRFRYGRGILYRSKEAVNYERGYATEGKKVGDYYYYTAWSFSGLASGSACVGIYGDDSAAGCEAEGKVFGLINTSENALLETIELAQ
jgi:prepilin-type N-terminal cleavage/methylation domain-containing protein